MKRKAFGPRSRQAPDVAGICRLATALDESGSQLEEAFWQRQLAQRVNELIRAEREEALVAALDRLHGSTGQAYDVLADTVEACAESHQIALGKEPGDALLVACPILCWSRYNIPAGSVSQPVLEAVSNQLGAHVLAGGTRFVLADYLFSPDQLPQNYADTQHLAMLLAQAAAKGSHGHVEADSLPPTGRYLSDVRYLLAGVVTPAQGPIFRWQEGQATREQALAAWQQQAGNALVPQFTGCAFELLLPDAYHSAGRNSDRASRPYALQAAVAFLQATLNVNAGAITAIVAPFADRDFEEFRVGFVLGHEPEVVHGVVWPLFGNEEDSLDFVSDIEATLRQLGLGQVDVLDHRFPREYCEDCGAPLYPNREGELVHAEMPEGGEGDRAPLLH